MTTASVKTDDDDAPAAFGTCTVDESGVVRCPPVEFAAAGAPATVRRDVILYRIGSESWRGATVNAAELARAVGRVRTPRPLRYPSSVTLESVRLAEGGRALGATVTLPSALDDEYHLRRRGFRCEWDAETKDLVAVDLVEVGRPTDPIAAPPATFARTERITAMIETPDAKRARIDARLANTDLGRAILAKRRHAAESMPPAVAAFSAPATTRPPLSPGARRFLEATVRGRAALAARDNPSPPASPSTTPPDPTGVPAVYQVAPAEPPPPIQVPDEAEGEFLAALWRGRGEAALAALDREIATLTNAIAWHADRYKQGDRTGWSGEVRARAADRARLQAMREAMVRAKGEKAAAFRPPAPASVAAAQAEAVVRATLSAGNALRLGTPATRLPEVEARIESLRARLAGPALPEGDKLAEVRDRWHKDRLELAALEAERPALERAVGGMLEKVLASLVSPIVAEAGGRESLARDLAEVRLSDPENRPAADPESAQKRAGLEAKLADLGASPTSEGGGRIVTDLQARHAALVAAVESDRREHREGIVAKAEKVVADVLAGNAWALDALVKASEKQPKAFHAGLAGRLKAALPEAVSEVGFLAYAHGI